MILAAPIALAVAIFVSEIAPARGRQFMQPILELLTGIPSIIYGILAVLLVVPLVREAYNFVAGGFFSNGFGLVAAGIVLAIMILPTITTLSIDSLRSLPNGLREASLALGATRWETIRKTLLPAGMTGITTGVILGMGRAIGETLAVAFVIGGAAGKFPFGFTDQWPFIKYFPTSFTHRPDPLRLQRGRESLDHLLRRLDAGVRSAGDLVPLRRLEPLGRLA